MLLDTWLPVLLALVIAVLLVLLAVITRRVLAPRSAQPVRHCPQCGFPNHPAQVRCVQCASLLAAGQPRPDPAPPAAAEVPRSSGAAYLVGLSGPFQDQRLPLGPTGLTLGRSQDNDLVLHEQMLVSRYHAEILCQDGAFVLRDLESANGTWVDGQRIVHHILQPGDRIQVGSLEWLFADSQWLTSSTPPPAGPRPVPPPVSPPLDSAFFDGFHLERLVGQGGMSQVYKARTADGQVVALKILQATDPYLVQKFQAEGNQIGPLLQGHPHIATVRDFRRSADGQLYLVMDYVEGMSLRQRLGQGPLGEREATAILGQACDALGHAHAAKVIHRDVKPENILIQPDGQVKVVDFGIARLTSAVTVTQDKLVGTPEYMSPEQAKGEPVQAASDVYSLGVVLYEMLTGDVPFPMPATGNNWRAAMTVVDQHIHAQPVPPRERVATISTDLEIVALRSLEKSWQRRYRDGKRMAQALSYQSDHRIPAPSLAAPEVARLVVLDGPSAGRSWTLALPLALGRNDLNPEDLRISRRHLQIELRGDGYWLQDLSVNGIWVNRTRVQDSVRLHPGDFIAVGESVLQLQEARA